MKGRIYLTEKVDNSKRKFGEALSYFPAYIINENGDNIPVLFSADDISKAMERAKRNMEDVPDFDSWVTSFGL